MILFKSPHLAPLTPKQTKDRDWKSGRLGEFETGLIDLGENFVSDNGAFDFSPSSFKISNLMVVLFNYIISGCF